jgi:hypothetical protein
VNLSRAAFPKRVRIPSRVYVETVQGVLVSRVVLIDPFIIRSACVVPSGLRRVSGRDCVLVRTCVLAIASTASRARSLLDCPPPPPLPPVSRPGPGPGTPRGRAPASRLWSFVGIHRPTPHSALSPAACFFCRSAPLARKISTLLGRVIAPVSCLSIAPHQL